MKCIIIDDEKTARVILKTLCNEIKSLKVLEDFPDAIQAITVSYTHLTLPTSDLV